MVGMHPESYEKKLIGQILIEGGYITFAQLNEARRLQLLAEPDLRAPLGEILCQLGYATSGQIADALRLQERGMGKSPI